MPEAAADIGRHDPNATLFDVKRVGEPVAHNVRHLRTRIERELVEPVIEGGDDTTAFERRHALPRGRDFMADLDRRIERLRDVDLEETFEEDIVAPVLVNQ